MTTKQKTLGQVLYEAGQKLNQTGANWDGVSTARKEMFELAAAAVVIEADKRRKQVNITRENTKP